MRRALAAALSLGLVAKSAAAQEVPCRLDGRLLPAARAILASSGPVDAEALRAMTEDAGLRAPEVLSWRAEGGDPARRDEAMRAWVRSRAPEAEGARCVALRDALRAAVALVPRVAEVLDRDAPEGVRAWQVLLPAGATDAAVLVAQGDGAALRVPIDAEGRASAQVAGDATLQVVLTRAGDVAAWARWRVGARTPEAAEDVRSSREVMRAINVLRARASVSPLRADPLLAAVAGAYAAELAARRQVAHVVEGVDARGRMARAGLRAEVVAEDVARAPTLDGAWRALTRSPAHRTNLIEARVDAVGVGVAGADGQVYLVVLMASRPGLTGAAP